MMCNGLAALALSFVLAAPPAKADDDQPIDVVLATPDTDLKESGADAELLRTAIEGMRPIGKLDWHTNYEAAYNEASRDQKMLFILFRDDKQPNVADAYERDVLAAADLETPLSRAVRVVLPVDAERPLVIPELPGLKLITHNAFKYMYGRQGLAVIDLTNPQSEHYGQVVSAHPFTPGRHYTATSTKIVLNLPTGTVTQRALIYAVRLHPAAPISTTDGKCHPYLCKQAREASNLMVAYGSVGHHDWGNRQGTIAAQTGRSAMEVAAMAGNTTLIDAAVQLVDQWYGSPAHWSIMSTPAALFGYDLVRDSAGNWWGTGLFAN